jgi:repressor LexA
MRPRPVTERQLEIFEGIKTLSKEGRGPSLRALSDHVGLGSTWALRRHLDILAKRGLIEREPKKMGGIKILSVSGVAA